jgi:hypothetical protein
MASTETSLTKSTGKKVPVQVSRHDIEFLVGDLVPIIYSNSTDICTAQISQATYSHGYQIAHQPAVLIQH